MLFRVYRMCALKTMVLICWDALPNETLLILEKEINWIQFKFEGMHSVMMSDSLCLYAVTHQSVVATRMIYVFSW